VRAIYIFVYETINITTGLLVCFYAFVKALNFSAMTKQKTLTTLWCLILGVLYAAGPSWLSLHMVWPAYCMASILFIFILTRLKLIVVVSALLLSFGISYVLYYIALAPVGLFLMLIESGEYQAGTVIDYNKPIFLFGYSFASAFQIFLAYLLFRTKRIRKGFPFIIKGNAIIFSLFTAGSVIIFTTWGKSIIEKNDAYIAYLYLVGVIAIGIGIFIWVKRSIKAAYLRWAKDHNKELYERKLTEKDEEIRRLTELSDTLRSANHSIIHRLAAVERGYVAMLGNAQGMEISEELAVALEDVQRVMRDYQEDVSKGANAKPLPSTKVNMLDALFGLFAERCADSKIDFNLIVTGSIPYMVENIIDQSKLETLIGDHLQDAVIAVNASDNPFRNILVMLGLAEDFYALTVFDSGIPFEVDTLIRLGTECITTHADTGGSGEGFMKTFETMRECGASLIIDEKEPGTAGHSKSVTIRFDGKGQYIINTYRPGDFPPSDRYMII
jgi:hypothetical protein